MSEYTEVEQPFLAQLAAQGWDVIGQGTDIPRDPTKGRRTRFREWLLPEVFSNTVSKQADHPELPGFCYRGVLSL